MDLVLTGASGFLGRNFLLRAPDGGRILALYNRDIGFPAFVAGIPNRSIVPVLCDLNDRNQIAAFVQKHGTAFDACLYLAAKVDIPRSVSDPVWDLTANAVSLINFLDHVHLSKLVYFSSGAVYDGHTGEVGPESTVSPTLPYAISKLASEQYVRFFFQRKRSLDNFLIVRFFGAYGPYEAHHKIFTRLIRALVTERNRSYTIYGDGQNLIDAMYVDDAVRATQRMLDADYWNATVNLACGNPQTIEQLVKHVASALKIPNVSIVKSGVANENNRFWGSTNELQKHYGFKPEIPLEDGMNRFAEFLTAGRLS